MSYYDPDGEDKGDTENKLIAVGLVLLGCMAIRQVAIWFPGLFG
jgi:hypothetical protein